MKQHGSDGSAVLAKVIMVAIVAATLYWVADTYYVMILQESAYAIARDPLDFFDAFAWNIPAHALFGRLGVLLTCLLGGWASAWFVYRWQQGRTEVAIRDGRLKLAETSASVAVWEYDPATDHYEHDISWPLVLGYDPDEVALDAPELDLGRIAHPEDWRGACEARRRYLKGDADHYECEIRVKGKGDKCIWLHAYGQMGTEMRSDGSLYMLGTHCDITERREAAEAIRRREQRFRSLFMNSPIGMIEQDWSTLREEVARFVRSANVDPAVHFRSHPEEVLHFLRQADSTGANEAALRLFEAQSSGQLLRELDRTVTKESLGPLGNMLTAVYEGAQRYSCDVKLRSLEGNEIEAGLCVACIPDENGWPVILSYVDLTQRKMAEEERRRNERGMEHRQRLQSLGVLTGGIAHDFNNLLVGILGNADLAMEAAREDERVSYYLSDIMTAARSAANLCKQMLAYAGKSAVLLDDVNLNQVIEHVHSMVRSSISAKARVRFELSQESPTMHGDASQVEQVVLNLVMNAADAVEEGGGDIILRTGTVDCTAEMLREYEGGDELMPGNYVYLEVADNGCGMNDETLHRVFEPFFTTKFSGRGLGMAAVTGIMRGHHGGIRARSQLGVGTTFRALFPFAAPKQDASETEPVRSRSTQPDLDAWSGVGTILFADDEDQVRDVGRRILERLGFSVVCARDGQEAVTAFAESPDLFERVILDLSMPGMDGIETWAEMRRIKPEVSVVICSGHGRREILQRVAPNKPAAVIEKPYEVFGMMECLRSLEEAEQKALATE
jgi:signal transduction histidine kinase/ActR/RegA family two-component response regulator